MTASWCLRILREIQATQIEHTHRFDTIDRRFDTIDAQPPRKLPVRNGAWQRWQVFPALCSLPFAITEWSKCETCQHRVARDKQTRSHVARDVLE
jgi:hypothetical protein